MDTWFRPLVPLEFGRSSARLGCPNRFYQVWLEQQYGRLLREALAAAGLPVQDLRFDLLGSLPTGEEAGPAVGILDLNPDFTFETFVVGEGNRLAYEAAREVAREPGRRYNPLVVCGGVGDGKTHLLHAIGHQLLLEHPELRVRQLSATRLFELLVGAVERRRTTEFRQELRSTDVLLLDDIHTAAGREGTQEELFHTFNALHTAGKQLVLTAWRPPVELDGIAERIRSRLLWGVVAQLEPSSAALRLNLAKTTATRLRWAVSGELLERFVRPLEISNRELVGLVLRAAGTAKLTGDDPETVLSQITSRRRQRAPTTTIASIIEAVSARLGLAVREITSPRRARALSRARQILAYLSHEHAGFSLPAIGHALGDRDHTTILYQVRKARSLLTREPAFADIIRSVRRQLDI